MNCTCAQVRVTNSTVFPDGLFVVVERARGNADGVVIAQPSPTATSSSSAPLSVCATDCDRCWSAPKVLRPPSSEINNWLDEVACALAGGRGEDEEKVAAANAPSSSSAASSSSTYPNARGLSHKVSAELKPHTGYLDLLVTWNNAETGATERARLM